MNVCEEHKNEREARGPERAKREARRSNRAPWGRSNLRARREARDENVPAKRADFFVSLLAPGFFFDSIVFSFFSLILASSFTLFFIVSGFLLFSLNLDFSFSFLRSIFYFVLSCMVIKKETKEDWNWKEIRGFDQTFKKASVWNGWRVAICH